MRRRNGSICKDPPLIWLCSWRAWCRLYSVECSRHPHTINKWSVNTLIMIMQLSNQNCHYVNIILSNNPRPHHGWLQCPQLMFWYCPSSEHCNRKGTRPLCHCADTDSQVDEVQTCLQWSTSLEYQPVHTIPPQLSSGKLNANFGSFIYLARVQFFHIYLYIRTKFSFRRLRSCEVGRWVRWISTGKYRTVQSSTV